VAVELGQPFSVSFRVWTGRNAIESLDLRISAPSATFRYKEASLDDGESAYHEWDGFSQARLEGDRTAFEPAKDSIKLRNLVKDATVRFSVPYSEAVSTQMLVSLSFSRRVCV
jgi:trafficking protein particle complex subunit 10